MLEFRETAIFTRDITVLLSEDVYAELQGALVVQPDLHVAGVLQRRAGRSLRKTETCSRPACEGGVQMKKELFEDLVTSVKQAGKIHRGQTAPSRAFVFQPEDVRQIREKLKKSQSEFARMIGVSVSTLQNWEQGRRQPEGPARALLVVASKAPRVVAKALAEATRRAS